VTTATRGPAGQDLATAADAAFERWGDRPSLWFEGRWYSSGELRDLAARWATGLRELGVRPGDRVVVLMPNLPEVTVAYAAAWRVGAVVTPVVFLISEAELAHLLADSGAVVAVTSPDFLPKVLGAAPGSALRSVVVVGQPPAEPTGASGGLELVPAERLAAAEPLPAPVGRRAEDLAALLYTGGTTGRAKGVMLTHAGMTAAGRGGAQVSYVPGVTRVLLPLPLSHAYGLLVSVVGLFTVEAGEAILMRWFDPDAFCRLAQEHRPQRAAVVPSMLALLLRPVDTGQYDVSSLRYLGSGGAPLAPELAEAVAARMPGIVVSEGYGMTETSALCTSSPPDAARPGTVGRAAPGYELRIVDLVTEEDLPPGGEGEILVRGPGLMAGYWGDEAATAEALRGGWLHTGDIGSLDADGYLRVVDRKKDLIIRGGFNVYPRDVEDALLQHPAVVLAGVVGRPDPVYGEEVVAFVSLAPGATVTGPELVAWARERMAANKYPREVRVVDAVPLTSVGKLDRKALRASLIAAG